MQAGRMVYLVESDESIVDGVKVLLGCYQITVESYLDAGSLLDAAPFPENTAACLVIAASLPNVSGLALVRKLRGQGCQLPVIVLSDTSDGDLHAAAIEAGATELIEKPFVNVSLVERILGLLG